MKINGSVTNVVNVSPSGPMCTPDQPDGPAQTQAPAKPEVQPHKHDSFDAKPKHHGHHKPHGAHEKPNATGGATATGPARPPTVDELRNGLLDDPNFKKLSPKAQEVARGAINQMNDPKELEAMRKQIASPWVQGLKPDQQAHVIGSFASENMTELERGAWLRRQITDQIR